MKSRPIIELIMELCDRFDIDTESIELGRYDTRSVREQLIEIVCLAMQKDECLATCTPANCPEVEEMVNHLIEYGVTIKQYAYWIEKTHNDGHGDYILYHCSNCDHPTAQTKTRKYCMNCGFVMEEP